MKKLSGILKELQILYHLQINIIEREKSSIKDRLSENV